MEQASGYSSQESLPLSQETFTSLLNMINIPCGIEMLAGVDAGVRGLSELGQVPLVLAEDQPLGACVPSTRSSLPAVSNWRGIYDFQLLFGYQEKINKQAAWVYSEESNKLYVQKDAVCPFSFQMNAVMPSDVVLRAMVFYSSPEHALEVVTRCVNHSQKEIMQGLFQAEHLVRSAGSQQARYEIHAENKHHSVVLQFENPPVGQSYSTYLFKFVCFSSCAGGPNRRAMTLVFTLEQGCTVLGRISLDLKICSSPGRDRDNDRKSALPENSSCNATSGAAAKKLKRDSSSSSISLDLCDTLPKKRLKEKPEKEKDLIIKVKDKECYDFLMGMKKLFQTYRRFGRLPPEYQAVFQLCKSSSEDERP